MRLTLRSQLIKEVAVVRCQGRIVLGPEVDALEAEVEKHTRIPGTDILLVKGLVLHLAEADYIDSSGLGALVRLLSVMRAAGSDVKLCELSPPLVRVLEITNLSSVLHTYASEQEAIEAFSATSATAPEQSAPAKTRILCVDTSTASLSYLKALLSGAGYDVITTRSVTHAVTLVTASKPRIVICGPAVLAQTSGEAALKLRHGSAQLLLLPSDFSTAEAGQAGVDVVNQVQAMLAEQTA